jgi:hypothetical protein
MIPFCQDEPAPSIASGAIKFYFFTDVCTQWSPSSSRPVDIGRKKKKTAGSLRVALNWERITVCVKVKYVRAFVWNIMEKMW